MSKMSKPHVHTVGGGKQAKYEIVKQDDVWRVLFYPSRCGYHEGL